MTILELKQWGDFDVKTGHSIWVHPEKNIKIPEFKEDMKFNEYIRILKSTGFVKTKTKEMTIPENVKIPFEQEEFFMDM